MIVRVLYNWQGIQCVSYKEKKHIDVKYHFIWEMIENKKIQLIKVYTKYIPIYLLTKGLPKEIFVHYYIEEMGIG